MHEQVHVSFDKLEALCILKQYEIELMYTFGKQHFNPFVQYFLLPNDYYVEIWSWSEFLYNSEFTLTSKIAWNKQYRLPVEFLLLQYSVLFIFESLSLLYLLVLS